MRDNQFGKYKPAFWSEYGDKIINEFSLKLTSKGEYHGACPCCGGTDRFWIKEVAGEVKVHCRQCNDFPEITKILRSMGLWPAIVEGAPAVPVGNLHDFEDHTPYHVRKGVGLGRAALEGNNVVIPIYGPNGKLVGTQTITPRGDKRFTAGMAKEGAFGVVGGAIEGVCYIAEGWATAASVSASTGRPAIFALDAGNLPKVAAVLKEIRPDAQLIVAADNDEPGIKAAEATGLPWATPKRAGDDWNDVMLNLGQLAVAAGLKRAIVPTHPLAMWQSSSLESTKAPEFVIDGVISAGAVLLAGGWGAGKTSQLLPLLCRAAHLCRADDPLKASIKRRVIYITEDLGQARLIIAAMRDRGELGFADENEVDDMLRMVEAKRLPVDEIIDVAGEYAGLSYLNTRNGVEYDAPAVIVFDTRSAVIELGDENDNTEAGHIISTLRQGFPDNPIIIVGHLSKALRRADVKDMSGRGAGAWEADTQQTLYLAKDDDETRFLSVDAGKHRFVAEMDGLKFNTSISTFEIPNVFGEMIEVKGVFGVPEIVARGERENEKAEREAERKAEAEAEKASAQRQIALNEVRRNLENGIALNRTKLKAAIPGNNQRALEIIVELLDERRLVEVTVTDVSILAHPKANTYLYPLSPDEHADYTKTGILPDAANVVPKSLLKDPISSVPAKKEKSAKSAKIDAKKDAADE
jgi:hypothetical protein